MKNYILCLFLCCIAGFCYAQDTVKAAGPELIERTNDPSSNIHEKYTVLKTDKKVKHGLFQAFYERKILVASGRYTNGIKTGVWRYNNFKGTIDQVYNYNEKKLLYTKRPDTAFAQFDFDTKITPTDTLTYPVKIGGNTYGYWFVLDSRIHEFSKDMHNAGSGTFNCLHILTIGADGILKSWQMLATGNNFKNLYSITLESLTEDQKLFVPATQNGIPVQSKVYIKTKTTLATGMR